LLLHGLGGTPNEMRGVADAVARAGHTVSVPQLVGHCGTYADLKKSRWQDWLASAERALMELRRTCGTVVVGGLSTGAVLSLHLAANHPAMVQGTVMLAPTLWLNGWMIPKYACLFRLIWMKSFANLLWFTDEHPHGIKDEAIRARVRAAMLSGDSSQAGLPVTPGGALLEHRWLVQAIRKRLGEVRQPTLIIHPREDDYADLDNISYLQRHLGGPVDTVTLTDSYHVITLDRQRDVVEDRTADFVARVRADALASPGQKDEYDAARSFSSGVAAALDFRQAPFVPAE
jgi:carboxylesterase